MSSTTPPLSSSSSTAVFNSTSDLPDPDLHLAAEALESLRSTPNTLNSGRQQTSVSPPPNNSFKNSIVLPPISTANSRHHHLTYNHRHSPYHSRSSSFSDHPDQPSSPQEPPPKKPKYPNFLNPLVSSAVKAYKNSKSFSPRFRERAERLESVISSRMSTTQNSPSNALPPLRQPQQELDLSQDQQFPTNNSAGSNSEGLSKWLVTATSLATSLSYENRQRLRYCLHLLKLANNHIATKVNQLQDLVQDEKNTASYEEKKNLFIQTVENIKKDIIWTIRKVVSALSTYAGNSLPEPARSHVRSYILRLPQRWVTSLSTDGTATPTSTAASSSASTNSGAFKLFNRKQMSPPLDPSERSLSTDSDTSTLMSPTGSIDQQQQSSSTNTEIAYRVLSLANEALDMLDSIINIFDSTLERANQWCDQQQQQQQQQQHEQEPGQPEKQQQL